MKRDLGLFFASIMLIYLTLPVSAQSESQFTANDCWFNNIASYAIDCGYVTVPEDHANPDGATIQLAVAVIHSDNPNKAPDPVLYLAGGPGAAFVNLAPLMPQRWGLSSLLINRDVILVDQRGMGLSLPKLSCMPYHNPMEFFDPTFRTGTQIERMQDCLTEFEAEGINWQAFTTEQNAADLAMIPSALGYSEYNIYGTSYGTLLGLIMLRDYPEGIRSAVLDSVLTPDNPGGSQGENFEATFSLIEKYCAADISCALAYPNLREQFTETYERLKKEPASVGVLGYKMPITAHFFADSVFMQSRTSATINRVPMFITGFAENDFDVILPDLEQILATPLSEYPDQAIYMTMVCPQLKQLRGNNAESDSSYHEAFADIGFTTADQIVCTAWGNIPAMREELPVSDVPTLLLAGEFDPLTPPYLAYHAAENLSNSDVIVMPYTGHQVATNYCGQQLLSSFINDPSQAPDTTCLSKISAPGFILHTTVTRPPIIIALLILGIIALFGLAQTLFAGIIGFRRIAWRASFRRLGFTPVIAAAILYFLILINAEVLPPEFVSLGVLQSMMPILIALQASAVFSAGDEPSLEIQLAAPRAILWIVLERFLAVFITYGIIAAGGVVLTLLRDPSQDFVMLAFSWIPPALFLSGLGIFITIRSRKIALGVIAIGFLWFMFALFSEFFLPGKSFAPPLHLIQPFMWPIHIHASLNDLTVFDYWINRLFMSATGISLMMGAVYSLRDTEQVLLNAPQSSRQHKKAATTLATVQTLKPHLSLEPVTIRIRAITQIFGIAKYEFMMRWRTRGMKVFVLAPIIMFVLAMIVMQNDSSGLLPFQASDDSMPIEQLLLARGEVLVFIASALFVVPAIYMFPILAADTVPFDEQIGVKEILGALPMSDTVYLIGKALGVTSAGLSAQLATLGIVGIGYRFWNGAYNPLPYFDLVIGMSLAVSILTSFAVFVGASQKSARRATALVIALLIVPEFLQSVEFIRWVLPSRVDFYTLYIWASSTATFGLPPTERDMVIFSPRFTELVSFSLIQLLTVSAIVIIWRRYRKQS